MNLELDYKDPLYIVENSVNGYGDNVANKLIPINGLFHHGMSTSRSREVEALNSDAHVYLDIENPYVIDNAFRLEGKLLIANLNGGDEKDDWYKIQKVVVGQRKLLDNAINNVHCYLSKASPLEIENGSTI